MNAKTIAAILTAAVTLISAVVDGSITIKTN